MEAQAHKRYIRIERDWRTGDEVELDLEMMPRLTQAHPYVEATRGCVAMERGPLVYCIEQADHSASINAIRLHTEEPLRTVWEENVCGGVTTIEASGQVMDVQAWDADLYRDLEMTNAELERVKITAVPYYAWGNRGADKMRVWLPVG